MKKNKILLTALAVVMALTVMIAPALAYFTDHTAASGSVAISLGTKTTITEKVDGWNKIISVANEGPESCYVRGQAFASDDMALAQEGSSDWKKVGDWWYYEGIVEAGGSTSELTISISGYPVDAAEGKTVDVAIVYESAKVVYNEDGTYPAAEDADWNMQAIEEGGAE